MLIYCLSFASEYNVESHVSWWLHGDSEQDIYGHLGFVVNHHNIRHSHLPFLFLKIMIMNTNLVLSKESSESEIKTYFNAVLELSKSENEFPINLDDVWAIAYPRKDHCVRALKQNFIQDVDFQIIPKSGENSKAGRPTEDYYISVSCLEYLIARKVRMVFEVYRQVFHKVANGEVNSFGLSKDDIASLKILAGMVRMMNIQTFVPPSNPEMVSPEYVSYKRMNSNRNAELDASVEHLIGNEDLQCTYYTVYAFARHNFIELDKYEAARLGNLSANLCRRNGFAIGKCADIRFGTINVYPREILTAVFRQRYPEHHINP